MNGKGTVTYYDGERGRWEMVTRRQGATILRAVKAGYGSQEGVQVRVTAPGGGRWHLYTRRDPHLMKEWEWSERLGIYRLRRIWGISKASRPPLASRGSERSRDVADVSPRRRSQGVRGALHPERHDHSPADQMVGGEVEITRRGG